MPFIHVKSLPFAASLDVSSVVEGVTEDFARETGIGLEHVTATWEFFLIGHYAVAGKTVRYQPRDSHPVIVDLLAFNAGDEVERMLRAVARSIAGRVEVGIDNIVVNYRQAHSVMVFDAGEVVRW